MTWGGEGAEQVFDLDEQDVKKLGLVCEIIYKRIGREDIKRCEQSG